MVTKLLISLDFEVALASPKPWWVWERSGGTPNGPFSWTLFRSPLPPSASASCPSGKLAPSRLQEVRTRWGQVQGQQDPELSGCLF